MATAPKSKPSPKVPPATTQKAPPVDNDHIEEGSEKFDESNETDPESISDADELEAGSPAVDPGVTATAPAQNASSEGSTAADDNKPPKGKVRSIADRVKDIETRWEKSIQEVMIEIHDHVFGASDPHEVATARKKEKAEKAAAQAKSDSDAEAEADAARAKNRT